MTSKAKRIAAPQELLNPELRRNAESRSGLETISYAKAWEKAHDATLISTDWFGTSLLASDGRFNGVPVIHIRNFEDLEKLNEEQSRAYLDRYISTSFKRGYVTLNHLLNFPPNIKVLVSSKMLSVFARRAIKVALIAKEIMLRITNPKVKSRRTQIDRVPISKGFIVKMGLHELVDQGIVTENSPLYLRELVGSTDTELATKLSVKPQPPTSASSSLFDQVFKSLSSMPIAIEYFNQSSILDDFFVIDASSSNHAQLEVGVNPVPVLQRLPPLNSFMEGCKRVIEISNGIPGNDKIRDTHDVMDSTFKGTSQDYYASTNPLTGDLINKNYRFANFDPHISVYFPEHLEYLAKLMREKKLKFEMCTRLSDHNENPVKYRNWVSARRKGTSTSGHISMSLRLDPEVENALLVIGFGDAEEMGAYTKLWKSSVSHYLQTQENIDLAKQAACAIQDFYSYIYDLKSIIQRMIDASLTGNTETLGEDGRAVKILNKCSPTVEAADMDTYSMLQEYTIENIGGFPFSRLQ